MKQLTDFVYEYPLTKDEKNVIDQINIDAQAAMMKFIGEHIRPKLKNIDPDAHTYKIKYNREKGTLKFKRVEQHREISRSNFANEMGWGSES